MELRDGLLGGWRYEDALSWLNTECGVDSCMSALSTFFRRHCKPVIQNRRKISALKAEAIMDGAGDTDWNAAILEDVKQMVFEFLQTPDADFEKTEKLLRMVLKSRDQDQSAEKIKILVEQHEASQEAKRKLEEIAKRGADGGMTETTLEEIEEAIGLL